MAENKPQKYADIPALSDANALFHAKDEYTYIINAEKYRQTGELETKRVLKKDLLPEASASYVFFKREGCHGYPLNEKDLTIKSPSGYVGPFQMNADACNAFLKYMKESHPDTASYITQKGTAGYMSFVKKYPDKEKLIKIIEDYALNDYFNNRRGKPDTLAQNLADHFKKTDENGNSDATRLPLHVIASLPTGVIARGNGLGFKKKIPQMTEENIDKHCINWISSNLGRDAYNKLKQIDYITPEIITQYQTMNLPGADNLRQKYEELVKQHESSKNQIAANFSQTLTIEPDALKISTITPEEINIKITADDRQKRLNAKLLAKETKQKLKQNDDKTKPSSPKEQPKTTPTNTAVLSYIKAEQGRS